MESPNLDAFSDQKDLVFVINRFNVIEEELAALITNNISPPKESAGFVKYIVLNNSIVSFSSKVKLFMHLRAINNWPKIDADIFHRLMKIRNQFAHCNNKIYADVTISGTENEEIDVSGRLMLESLTNNGLIEAVESSKALQEFTEKYSRIRKYLRQLPKKA